MTTRRQVLQGLPAVWLTTASPLNASARKPSFDDMVAELSARLEEAHGGTWKSTIDSHGQFVMLCRH
jgi:hypothetical protein